MKNISAPSFLRIRDEVLKLQPNDKPTEFCITADGKHGLTHTYKVTLKQGLDKSIDVGVTARTSFFSKGHAPQALADTIRQFAQDTVRLSAGTKKSIAIIQPKNEQETVATKTLLQKMDNLYQKHNIIGYTQGGGASQKPTVYYRSDSGSWGHITQEHEIKSNIGREAPIKDARYVFENRILRDGKPHLYEASPKHRTTHTSRGAFIPVDQNDAKRLQALSQAESAHPTIKALYQGQIKALKSLAGI